MPRVQLSAGASASSIPRHFSTAPVFPLSSRRWLLRSLLPASGAPPFAPSFSPALAAAGAPIGGRTAGRAPSQQQQPQSMTTLPLAHPRNLPDIWFSAAFPPRRASKRPGDDSINTTTTASNQPGGQPPDERTIKLGRTLRILQERLPTLLQSPLPAEILAPTISLHLFPSTHPHLPVVSGRVAYVAALWTSPLAWNRVPIVGNVRLAILSERVTKQPLHAAARRAGAGEERLVVRWRTISKTGGSPFSGSQIAATGTGGATTTATTTTSSSSSSSSPSSTTTTETRPPPVGTAQAVDDPAEFTGLFIFEFDREGRVLSHTIEHVAEGGDWERSVGARFVGLTDWLLGGIRGSGGGSGSGERGGSGNGPLPAFEMQDPQKFR
ncbi:hypothetical protein SPI_05052 [Niveomyces insectorum RCEF 264]|uniref:Chromosome transmission fidelity protein 4 n=1 Tax=Niveomyces insectorum RCEF 264 TaxID=1081102 RepID=A0A167TWN2_9HYPO|nr:hypothetical protein SPI_05052 [Niveomyces insectorum RCEF 264]